MTNKPSTIEAHNPPLDEEKDFIEHLVESAAKPIKDGLENIFPTKDERQLDRKHRAEILEFEKERFRTQHAELVKNNDAARWILKTLFLSGLLTSGVLVTSQIFFGYDSGVCAGLGILGTTIGTAGGFFVGSKSR